METNILPRPLRGIVPPLVTPLLSPDTLDHAGLERLIEHTIGGGVHGLFILGTTGDGPALSYRLRQEVIEHTCAQVAGRVPVLVAVTDTSFTESRRIADIAARAGADALVLAPPYYFHLSQSDLLRVVEGMAGADMLPIFLYNIPSLTKTQFHPETVRRASAMPHVFGLKDSSGDLDYLKRVLAAVRDKPEFSVLLGPEHLLLQGLQAGVHGGVCGGANLVPRSFVELFDAFSRNDLAQARALQDRILSIGMPLYQIGEPESSYIRGLKAAIAVAGLCSPELAWPFLSASPEQVDTIRDHLAATAPELHLEPQPAVPSRHG